MADIFLPGTLVELYAYFKVSQTDPLIDTDTPPAFQIYKGTYPLPEITGTSTRVSTGIYKAQWNTEGVTIDATQTYKIVWIATIKGNPVTGAEETFNFQSTSPLFYSSDPTITDPSNVIISAADLNVIKSVLAYPLCDESTLLLTDQQIGQLVIYPAMLEYFTKFPIEERDQFAISDTLVIPFPDQFVYGVVDCRIVGKFAQATGRAPAFWNLILYNKYSPYSSGMFASYSNKFRGYNPNGLRQNTWNQRQVWDTWGNQMTNNLYINKAKRQIEAESNNQGFVEVCWARYSVNFEDIPYERKIEVINLAQANLLQHFVSTMQISQEPSADIQIGLAEMQTMATELRQRVIDIWNSTPSGFPYAMRVS